VLTAILSFAAFAALVTITPGLDTMVVVRTAAISGRGAAFAAAFGVGLGCLCWAVAGGLGLTALLTASQLAYDVVRWVGAGYLIVLGVRALRSYWRKRRAVADATPLVVPVRTPWAAFRVGLVTNLLNPKAGVFYLAALPQFLPRGVPSLPASIVLGAVHDVEGLIWFTLLIFVVGRAATLLTKPSVQRRLEVVTGVAFVGFGLRLALARD